MHLEDTAAETEILQASNACVCVCNTFDIVSHGITQRLSGCSSALVRNLQCNSRPNFCAGVNQTARFAAWPPSVLRRVLCVCTALGSSNGFSSAYAGSDILIPAVRSDVEQCVGMNAALIGVWIQLEHCLRY